MGAFGPKLGTWWVSSKIDPRWNKQGRGCGLVTSGGPSEAWDWIEKATEEFGEEPADLEIGFMKD